MSRLFGYFLDKYSDNNEDGIVVFSHFIDELKNPDTKINKQRIVVRTNRGDICTDFYFRTYLCFIHSIFLLSGTWDPDLSNFDEPIQPK